MSNPPNKAYLKYFKDRIFRAIVGHDVDGVSQWLKDESGNFDTKEKSHTNTQGQTPLMLATEIFPEVVPYLIEAGHHFKDIDAIDSKGISLINLVIFSRQTDWVKLLLESGHSPNGIFNPNEALLSEPEKIYHSLKSSSPFFLAGLLGQLEIVDLLLNYGAVIFEKNQKGECLKDVLPLSNPVIMLIESHELKLRLKKSINETDIPKNKSRL